MEERISGTLQVSTLPDGEVETIFSASNALGDSQPIRAKNLDIAEEDWVTTFGLTPATAARLRAELQQNETASAETKIDPELAATLCVPRVRETKISGRRSEPRN
jgi:hypothetical protein